LTVAGIRSPSLAASTTLCPRGTLTLGAVGADATYMERDDRRCSHHETNTPSETELMELDIDIRLHHLWQEARSIEKWTIGTVSAFMRAAYGKGYIDALAEERRGSLCADHGYRIPKAH